MDVFIGTNEIWKVFRDRFFMGNEKRWQKISFETGNFFETN